LEVKALKAHRFLLVKSMTIRTSLEKQKFVPKLKIHLTVKEGNKSMLQNLQSYFDDFICDRVIDIEEQVISTNMKMQNLIKDYAKLFNKIKKSLPKEDSKLIFRYEEKLNEVQIVCFQIIYKQGLIDGFKTADMYNEPINRDIVGK